MDRDDPAYRGQSEYTRPLLRLYDPLVLGPIARFVWRCPTTRLVDGYRQHIRDRHLDVGPGTGYFLERSGVPSGSRVTIVDPNTNVLDHASRRLRHLDVTAVEADVLKPLPVDGPFDSAALHLVIHCLPGPPPRKATAVANVAAVLAPTGVLFGASVLGTAGPQTWLSRGAFGLQPAGRLRQPRRHGGRAPRDPGGVIRTRGARDRRLDRVFAARTPRTDSSP
jgi:SAM-dependent methyltransferase